MWPRGVCGGNSTAWVAQPNRTSGAAATLTSRRSPVRVIVHEHRLRERVVAVVGQGQQHVTAAAGQTQLARAAVEHQARRLAALAADLEIAPAHAEAQPAAERLRGRLLGREARGEVGHGIAPRAAVGDLALREDAAQEALVPARDDVAHARDPDEVHADARSEEHTSELQSRQYLVCRLLLEKKKNSQLKTTTEYQLSCPRRHLFIFSLRQN